KPRNTASAVSGTRTTRTPGGRMTRSLPSAIAARTWRSPRPVMRTISGTRRKRSIRRGHMQTHLLGVFHIRRPRIATASKIPAEEAVSSRDRTHDVVRLEPPCLGALHLLADPVDTARVHRVVGQGPLFDEDLNLLTVAGVFEPAEVGWRPWQRT